MKNQQINNATWGKKFVSRFLEPGLCGYETADGQYKILLKKETIDEGIAGLIGHPLINGHQEVTPENMKEFQIGLISDVYYNEEDGFYYCEGIVTDEDAINQIQQGAISVSCAYNLTPDDIGNKGIYHSIEYDFEVKKIDLEHLALVDTPRYEGSTISLKNSKGELIMKSIFGLTKKNDQSPEHVTEGKKIENMEMDHKDIKESNKYNMEELEGSSLDIDGTTVTISELVEYWKSYQKDKKMDKKMTDDDIIMMDNAEEVTFGTLVNSYKTKLKNEEEKADKEKSDKEEADKDEADKEEKEKVENAKIENEKKNFYTLQNAAEKDALSFEKRPPNILTLQEKLAKGKERY